MTTTAFAGMPDEGLQVIRLFVVKRGGRTAGGEVGARKTWDLA